MIYFNESVFGSLWLAIISPPSLHIWVGSWLHACVPFAAGGGRAEFQGGGSPPSPRLAPQEHPSHPLVVPTTLHRLMEEPGQQAQARQLKLNKMSSALGVSQTPRRQRLLGAQKSRACWINSPGKGCGEERQGSAPKAQIYPSETLEERQL